MGSVTDGAWNITATPGSFHLDDGRIGRRVDVRVAALAAARKSPSKPHGFIGQSLHDTFPIHGKRDDYVSNSAGEFWTTAQGEGALEGVLADYEISGGPYGTSFRFSRFDAIPDRQNDAQRITDEVSDGTLAAGGAVGDSLDEQDSFSASFS